MIVGLFHLAGASGRDSGRQPGQGAIVRAGLCSAGDGGGHRQRLSLIDIGNTTVNVTGRHGGNPVVAASGGVEVKLANGRRR